MADIDVQRKRGIAWLWVVLLGLVALAAWGLWELLDENEVADVGGGDAPTLTSAAPLPLPPPEPLVTTAVLVVDPIQVSEAMRAYTAHVESDMPADGQHLYAASGIGHLATALGAIVGKEPGPDPEVIVKANAFLAIANLLVASPDSLRVHADWMHRTALAAVDVMQEVQETRFPDIAGFEGELQQARQAANAIEPAEGLLGQTAEVRQFFREAEDPLRLLADSATATTENADR